MANLNKVLLLGNVTRDPEVRYTPKGSAVCDLGIAVNRQFTLDSGEKREEVTFVEVTLWGRTAEIAGEYLRKGRPVFIEGRLQMDTWDDKQTGQKRSRRRAVAKTCSCWAAALPPRRPKHPGKTERPRRRPNRLQQPSRTKTRFRFNLAGVFRSRAQAKGTAALTLQ